MAGALRGANNKRRDQTIATNSPLSSRTRASLEWCVNESEATTRLHILPGQQFEEGRFADARLAEPIHMGEPIRLLDPERHERATEIGFPEIRHIRVSHSYSVRDGTRSGTGAVYALAFGGAALRPTARSSRAKCVGVCHPAQRSAWRDSAAVEGDMLGHIRRHVATQYRLATVKYCEPS